MKVKNFQSMLQKQPFRPFRIHTARGESYPVTHPEVVWVQPDGEVVIVFVKTAETADVVMIDLDSVTEVVSDKLVPKGKEGMGT